MAATLFYFIFHDEFYRQTLGMGNSCAPPIINVERDVVT